MSRGGGRVTVADAKAMPFGRYELMERVAMGGMAEVFRAHGTGADGFRKEVCIKRILPQFCEDEDFVRMFKDEAKLAARLSHANIVQIFDFDQVDGSYFIAMEYVAGKDLRTVIRTGFQRGQPPGVYRAASVVAEMCKGLHYAHQKDGLHLVHRDVSPHNVLVSMAGEVKVMDFGIAKAADRVTRTSTGVIKGKIAYMAPEQAAGGDLDHRVDQFATGLVLYELLTGRRAFDGPEPVALRKALNGEVEPPSLAAPDTPPELDEIFARATARNPADRYPDMRAMERALMAFVYRRAPEEEALDLGRYMHDLFGAGAAVRARTAVVERAQVAPPAEDPRHPSEPRHSAPTEGTPVGPGPGAEAPPPATPDPAPAVSAPTVTSLPSAATAGSLPSARSSAPSTPDPHATVTVQGTPTPHLPPSPEEVLPPASLPGAQPPTGSPPPAASSPRLLFGAAFAGALVLGTGAVALFSPGPTSPPATIQAAVTPAAQPVPAVPAPPATTPDPAPGPTSTGASPSPSPPTEAPADTTPADGDRNAPKGRGKVRVVNQGGWAQVWVRNRMVLAETPGDFSLDAGKHVLLFKNPETGRQATLTVTVKAGGTTRVVQPLQ